MSGAVGGPPIQESYRLRRDADLRLGEDGSLTLRQTRFQLTLEQPGMGRRGLLLRLADDWVSDVDVGRLVSGLEGESRVLPAQLLLRRLLAHSWLERRVQVEQRPLLDLMPTGLGRGSLPENRRHLPGVRYRLSRFAVLQHERDMLVAASPLSALTVGCVDAALGAVLAAAAPGVGAETVARLLGVPPEAAGRVLDELATARILVTDAEFEAERDDAPLAYWSPEELRLHHRSRVGGHALPVGGTYRLRERFGPQPLRRRYDGSRAIELPLPDLATIAKADPGFGQVVAERRSVREHDAVPLAVERLAEFLYRSQHTVAVGEAGGQEIGHRPYPGGGGVYELEIYPLVARCAGLDPGLYHYDAVGHRLEPVADWGPAADRLLAYARAAGAMPGSPQTVLVVTARVQRLMWKYEGMSYAMILKDAGVLTHQMYLVATAMGLAPCALGAGDSHAFAELSGLDPLVEPSVADFLLGSRVAAGSAGQP
ncbi:SagB family peptide dehydrogenase [Micromonospora endolithica]|uniref:SagB/ThcOx family dehydrogenase n=1 Tax=Micromonospora endolithica TaxID=230091 RepID=A0A3A9ZGC0_9ACTN|nr:SagB family peptide dehydrogenase [Micromonospora endolithica]RKN47592.1 SagB/ThcOx family dehydrogenase [Micromonospora endolithica]TWJ21241.1 SagB-type dehydrogenase family enzyme [Micromonospora endolithica]